LCVSVTGIACIIKYPYNRPGRVGISEPFDDSIRIQHASNASQPRGRRYSGNQPFVFVEKAMSIFSTILSKIFPVGHPAAQGAAPTPTPAAQAATDTPAAAPAAAQAQPVDVEAVLTGLAKNHAEQLNWRTSIVDLMKLLNLDSSLTARKQLAQELHFSGDMNDSAQMNVWLQKQVMTKLAENGGKVPDDLKN
jgi:Domain of unknown function (DUF3597)